MYKPGKENSTRVELRSPDPACNPYLAFAVMLAAGLKGIEENYSLTPPIEEDVFKMTDAQRKANGIGKSTVWQQVATFSPITPPIFPARKALQIAHP